MKTVAYSKPTNVSKGFEKPTMYGTVVSSTTKVLHPTMKPNILNLTTEQADFSSEPDGFFIPDGQGDRIGNFKVGVNLDNPKPVNYVQTSFLEKYHHFLDMHSHDIAKKRSLVHASRMVTPSSRLGLPTVQTSGLKPLAHQAVSESANEYFNDLPKVHSRKLEIYHKYPGHAFVGLKRKHFIPS